MCVCVRARTLTRVTGHFAERDGGSHEGHAAVPGNAEQGKVISSPSDAFCSPLLHFRFSLSLSSFLLSVLSTLSTFIWRASA
jgi:hypothetical protein